MKLKRLVALIVILLACVPLFYDLGVNPIYRIDESRLALNALEMHENDNYLVTYYDGAPDMWNTKPPLMVWAQVLAIKLLGPTEFAIRLPAAIAGLLTCGLLLYFCTFRLDDFWLGCLSVLILATTEGYIAVHVARSGDYDAFLVLFSFLAFLSYYTFLESHRTKYLYLFFMAILFGALTKGITIFMILPAFLCYTLCKKKLFWILKNRHLYLGLFSLVLLVGSYYTARESANPGFLEAVYYNEIGGRYTEALTEIRGGPLYYLKNLWGQMHIWLPFSIAGIILYFDNSYRRYHSIVLFSMLVICCLYLVISFAATKLPWYDAPLFPFYAFLAALSIRRAYIFFTTNSKHRKKWTFKYVPLIVMLLLFLYAYLNIGRKVKADDHAAWYAKAHRMELFLKEALDHKLQLDSYTVVYDGYEPQVEFYINLLQRENIDIHQSHDFTNLSLGQHIIIYKTADLDSIRDNYQYATLQNKNGVHLLQIKGKN